MPTTAIDCAAAGRRVPPAVGLVGLVGVAGTGWTLGQLLYLRVGLGVLWGAATLWAVVAAVAAGLGLQAAALAWGAPRRRAGLVLRDAFSLLVLAAAGHVALFAAGSQATIGLAVAAAATALASRRWGRSRRLQVLAFNVAALLVGGELGLRALSALRPLPIFERRDASMVEHARLLRLAPGSLHLGFPANRGGHYDEEFEPPERRTGPAAVMIGDSFSASVVPHHFHFTTVCERTLGRGAVYNMGVAGTGPRYYLHLLREEALPLRPDVIAVNLFVGNDIAEAVPPPGRGWRGWLDRDQLLLWLVPSRLWTLAVVAPTAVGAPSGGERRLSTPAELVEAYPSLADWRREVPARTHEQYLALETTRAWSACAEAAPLQPVLDVLQEMRAAAGDVPFVVVLIPDEFQVEDGLWREVEAQSRVPLDRDRPQRVIGAFLGARGIPCLDLLPELRGVPVEADGGRHCYLTADTHFNARGNEVAGRAMARFLAPYLAP